MRRRPLRVVIEDPKVYSYVVAELRKRGIPLSDASGIEVRWNKEDPEVFVGKAVTISSGKEWFEELVIGIDTNSRDNIALVVVGDGEILEYERVQMESLCREVKRITRMYPHKREVIGVGSGNPIGVEAFIELSNCSNAVKLVDERSTSRRNVFLQGKFPEDVVAAYNIAMRALT